MRSFYNSFRSSVYALPNGTEPLVFLDFKNGIYTVDGAAVALNTVLAQNLDFGAWNPANIQAGVGLNGGNTSQPVFTGDALDLILSGSTVVSTFILPAPDGNTHDTGLIVEMIDSLDYNTDLQLSLYNVDPPACRLADNVHPRVDEAALVAGTHQFALTMIDGKLSRSTDGGTVATINPAAAWSPAPTVMLFGVGDFVIIETIGLYPAQPDADLPMLSAL